MAVLRFRYVAQDPEDGQAIQDVHIANLPDGGSGGGGSSPITDVEVTTLDPGEQATATLDGTVLKLGIPQGVQGDPGDPGIEDVSANTLPAGSEATADINDETKTLILGIPKGDQGEQGPAGVTSVGATSVPSTAEASATLEDGALTLEIPRGADGTSATIASATATVDNTSGDPKVTVTPGGTDTARTFEFAFTGINGSPGAAGAAGATITSITLYKDTESGEIVNGTAALSTGGNVPITVTTENEAGTLADPPTVGDES